MSDLPIYTVWSVQILSDKTATCLKSFTPIADLVHSVLLIFIKECEALLIESGHNVQALLTVGAGKSKAMIFKEIGGLEGQYMVFHVLGR